MSRRPDTSLDFKLFQALFLALFLLFGFGGLLFRFSDLAVLAIVFSLATLLIAVAVVYRRHRHWRWRGATSKNVLRAVVSAVCVALFLFAATPSFPPTGIMLPWYLAGAAIGVWSILNALNVTRTHRTEFEEDCAPQPTELVEAASALVSPRTWRDAVADIYGVLFFLVWLSFVAFFYLHGLHMRDGAKMPDAVHVYPVEDYPDVAYVSAVDGQVFDTLKLVVFIGTPVMMIAGLVLQYAFKVPLARKPPTSADNARRR